MRIFVNILLVANAKEKNVKKLVRFINKSRKCSLVEHTSFCEKNVLASMFIKLCVSVAPYSVTKKY